MFRDKEIERDDYANQVAEKARDILRDVATERVEQRIEEGDYELLDRLDSSDIISIYTLIERGKKSEARLIETFERHKETMIAAEMQWNQCLEAAEDRAREMLEDEGIYDPDEHEEAA